MVGRYVVLGERSGVRVLDATNGPEHWHYRHHRMNADRVIVSADGKTIFLLLSQDVAWADDVPIHMAVGLDVATGKVRWLWDKPRAVRDYSH